MLPRYVLSTGRDSLYCHHTGGSMDKPFLFGPCRTHLVNDTPQHSAVNIVSRFLCGPLLSLTIIVTQHCFKLFTITIETLIGLIGIPISKRRDRTCGIVVSIAGVTASYTAVL